MQGVIYGFFGFLFLAGSVAQAQFAYTTNADNTITITEYEGPVGAVSIPEIVDGLQVTGIASGAFGMNGLTSVTIPHSVTTIANLAFYECSNLTSVTISNGVATIGTFAFGRTALTEVFIPPSVTNLSGGAFSGCMSLMGITVHPQNSNYTDIDGVVFDKSQATLVQYPGGVTGNYAIPDSVTSCGDYAFDSTAVAGITIPIGVTNIGYAAFWNTLLTSVTVSCNVGEYAFGACSKLTDIRGFLWLTQAKSVEKLKKREEPLEWKWWQGQRLFLVDSGGPGVAPLRAGLRFAAAPLRRSEVFGWMGRPVSARVVGMSMDTELQKHYALLLGIGSPWEVKTVELKIGEKKVEIELGWQWGQSAKCPECGVACSIHDSAPERTWRHLDTMQFATLIRARTPRADCPVHGVKTMQVPWAEPQGRFTLLFERFAVEVLLASASVSQACELLNIGWETAHEMMGRAVKRGLERRQLEAMKHLGMDEKSFGRGQSYITLLTDLEQSRVIDVVEDRTTEAAEQLWQALTPEQKQAVEAVAVDMWEPFIRTIEKEVPEADIVHDKFHISKYLGEAVDKVRREEHKELMAEGDETLKGTRQLWLYNPENFSPEQRSEFGALKDLHLKVARAWAAKELFTKFWDYQEEGWARRFFKDWFGWVSRSRLKPVVEVAHMLKRHLENLLTYLKHHITNAVTEGLNSKIQSIKSNARGFRSFKNYRIRILFFCGKLDLYPL